MYEADAVVTSQLIVEAYRIGQAAAAAMVTGWLAERTLDTGLPARGIAPFAGLAGLYVGPAVWALGGWDAGPRIGDFPIAPAVAGAFAVCTVLKLVGLGFASPRS